MGIKEYGHGKDERGRFLYWDIDWYKIFFKRFKPESLNNQEDLKAIMYGFGGPLPSQVESYEGVYDFDTNQMRFYIIEKNGLQHQHPSD